VHEDAADHLRVFAEEVTWPALKPNGERGTERGKAFSCDGAVLLPVEVSRSKTDPQIKKHFQLNPKHTTRPVFWTGV
jgi:hypothetical protein